MRFELRKRFLRGVDWAKYLLDPRWMRDLNLPPLRFFILIGAFVLSVIGTTVGIVKYSARVRGIFSRVAQAAIVKTTGYEVYIDDFRAGVFPPQVTIDGVLVRRSGERPFFTASRIRVLPGIARGLAGKGAIEWLEVRSPTLRLTYRNGSFEELEPLLHKSTPDSATQTKLPFELWGALLTRGRIQINMPGRALVEIRGLNLFAAPRATGSIPVEVMVPPISIELPNRRVLLEDIHIALAVRGGNLLQPKKVQLRAFEFISDAGTLQTKGNLDLDKKEGSLSVRTNIDLDIANLIDPALPPLSGRVAVRAEIDAEKDVPVVYLDMDGSGVSVGGKVIGDLHAELGASTKSIDITKLVLKVALGEATVTGHLIPKGDHPFAAAIDWTGLELASILETAGLPEVWPSMRSNGSARVEGRLLPKKNDPVLTGSAKVDVREFISRDRSWRLPDYLPILKLNDVAIETKIALYDDHLDLSDAKVSDDAGQIDCNARFHFDHEAGFSITGRSDLLTLEKLGRIANIDIRGTGNLRFDLAGPYGPPRIEAEVSLADMSVAGLPLGHVDSNVLFEDTHTLEFPDAVSTLGNTQIQGKGALDFAGGPSLVFEGTLEEGEIKDLLPLIPLPDVLAKSLSGDVGGDFKLSGLAGKPTLDVNFASDGFEAVGQPFEHAIGKVSMVRGVFEQMTLSTHIGPGAIEVTLDNGPQGINVAASAEEVPTKELRFLQQARDSLVGAMDARIDATLGKEPIGEATMTVHKLSIAGRPPQEVTGQMWLKGDEVRFDASTFEGRLSVHGKADIGVNPGFELEGSLQRAAVGGMLGLPSDYEVLASGAVSLSGPFSGLEMLKGELQLDQLSVNAPTLDAITKNRATLTLGQKKLTIENVELSGRGLDVAIGGHVALDGKMNIGLTGRVEGETLQPFIPTLEMIKGSVPLDIKLSGALTSPDLHGGAKLEDMRLKFSFLDKMFEQLSGTVTLQGDTFAFDNLKARFGDGTIAGSGSVRIADSDLQSLTFGFDLADVRYTAPGDLPLVLEGRVRVDTNRAKLFEVTGDVHIKEMRYTYDLTLEGLMPSFKRKPTQTRTLEKSDERVLFDVHIKGDENIIIDNNIAQADLKADLRLTGTNLRTGLLGTITPNKAQIMFQNHTYQLTSGSVDFVERYQILPRADLILKTNACAAEITVGVSGTADNYVMDFRGRDANGTVRQEDIQSCLAFGFRQSEFTSVPGVSRATGANEVLPIGLNLLGTVTGIDRKLKEYFRIDEVRFTAGYIQRVGRGSRVSPRIVVGKDIGGGVKLRLTSSLIDTDDQKLELIFPIGDFTTANLGWANSGDYTNDLGFDLKWHKDF